MVELVNLRKSYAVGAAEKVVADNLSFTFPKGVSVALLGRNGAGKSTLLQIIAGSMNPDNGQVIHNGNVSWPVGFSGSFHADMTGAQNIRFIARIYGVDTSELVAYVEDFAELGGHFHQPVRTYSSGMKSRLAFGASMGIKFDTYLVDEVTSVGDARFKRKCNVVFLERMQSCGAIVVSHSMTTLKKLCQTGVVLENGRLSAFDTLAEAIAFHEETMT